MLQIIVLLNTNYLNESGIEDIPDDCMIEFVNGMSFDSFTNLYLKIENIQVKNLKWKDRRETKLYKLITFVYSSLIDFPDNKFEIKTVITNDFFKMLEDSYMIVT